MTKMVDVAARAGVSIATVSRVLNNQEVVNDEMVQRVLSAVRELNYRPNRSAQALKKQLSSAVGVVLNSFNSSYFGELIEGIDHKLRKVNFATLAETSLQTAEGQIAAWSSLMERQCEAIVLHADMVPKSQLQKILSESPTTVVVNQCVEGFEDRCVYLDNAAAGQLAAQRFMDLGHRNIAMLAGPSHLTEIEDRSHGFLTQLDAHGITLPNSRIEYVEYDTQLEEAVVSQWVRQDINITSIFAYNDVMAAIALSTCRALGVRIPDDISIMGFDGVEFTQYLTPKLTTIRQPLYQIGASAAGLAHSLARSKTSGNDIQRVFQATLVEGGSMRAISYQNHNQTEE